MKSGLKIPRSYFNGTGDFGGLFHYKNGDIVYADLWHVGEDTIVRKECLVEINFRTEEVTKISNDKMICNFLMSPDGKIILCNHRSDEYWSVFDIAARIFKIHALPFKNHVTVSIIRASSVTAAICG